jgi:hypothetical protein
MPFDQFQKSFLFRIAEELDRDSSLYEVRSSNRGCGVLIIVECHAALAAPPSRDEMPMVFQSFGSAYTIASCRTSSSDDDPGHHELIS